MKMQIKNGEHVMTLQELGQKLNEMYFNSEDGEAVAMIHLFGIKYASEIIRSGESKAATLKQQI